MKPLLYFDVEVRGDADLAKPIIVAVAIQTVHAASHCGRYAVNFPDLKGRDIGARMRVFSESADVISDLRQALLNSGVDGLVKVHSSAAAPASDAIKSWSRTLAIKNELSQKVARRMRRVAAGKTNKAAFTDEEIALLKEKDKDLHASTPFLKLRSLSTRQQMSFQVLVEYRDSVPFGISAESATPNSLGLASRGKHDVWLPVF